jgi:hypothetical protein
MPRQSDQSDLIFSKIIKLAENFFHLSQKCRLVKKTEEKATPKGRRRGEGGVFSSYFNCLLHAPDTGNGMEFLFYLRGRAAAER